MRDLLNFLEDLARDPRKLEEFEQDPEAVLGVVALSDAEKEVVRSRDSRLIANAFEKAFPDR